VEETKDEKEELHGRHKEWEGNEKNCWSSKHNKMQKEATEVRQIEDEKINWSQSINNKQR